MSDLAERLRKLALSKTSREMAETLFEWQAADEIERLETALAQARRDALEQAAEVCDGRMFLGLPPLDYRKGWHAATRSCTAAIRVLIDAAMVPK